MEIICVEISKISYDSRFLGHIFRSLECRRVHKTFLEHQENAFLLVTLERSHWDGAHLDKDIIRNEINRIGTSHAGLGVRWKERNDKHVAKRTSTSKLKQQAKKCPTQSISGSADVRKGTFEDLVQICCLGMERSKIENVIDSFQWTKE